MRRERQRALQSDQCQIVLVSEEVVLGMDHFLRDSTLHVRQSFLHRRKIILAHSDPDLRGQQAATEAITIICFVLHSRTKRRRRSGRSCSAICIRVNRGSFSIYRPEAGHICIHSRNRNRKQLCTSIVLLLP